MLAALLLFSLRAELITVRPGPGQTCPSADEQTDALSLRLPGALVDDPQSADAQVMTLEIFPDAGVPGTVSVLLRAPGGELRLERRLPSAKERTRGTSDPRSECKALADTIALIVERHVRELGLVVGAATRRANEHGEKDKIVLEKTSGTQLKEKADRALFGDAEDTQTGAHGGAQPTATGDIQATSLAELPGWEVLGLGAFGTGRSYPAALAFGLGLRGYWGASRTFFTELQVLTEYPESLSWARGAEPPGRGTVRGHVFVLWVGRRIDAITRTLSLSGHLDVFACGATRLLVVQELTPVGADSTLALEPMVGFGSGWSVRPVSKFSSWFVRLSGWGGMAFYRHIVRTPLGTHISETPRIFGNFALSAGLQF